MENGQFKYVLYVENLSSNLLSIYQITHYGCGNKVEFLPNLVMVQNLKDDLLVAVGKFNHDTRLYSFSHFVPKSPSHALLTQSHLKVDYGMSGMDILPSPLFINFSQKT